MTSSKFAQRNYNFSVSPTYRASRVKIDFYKPMLFPNHVFLIELCRFSTRRFDSLTWKDYFAQELFFNRKEDNIHLVHHAYFTPPIASGPLFVTHHGAGSSGLSFAICAREIQKILPNAGVISVDARYHGSSTVASHADSIGAEDLSPSSPSRAAVVRGRAEAAGEPDFRLETLSQDLVFVVKQARVEMGWAELPDIVLVGHSLGGAVVTEVASQGWLGAKVLAYAVLDVVEGEF